MLLSLHTEISQEWGQRFQTNARRARVTPGEVYGGNKHSGQGQEGGRYGWGGSREWWWGRSSTSPPQSQGWAPHLGLCPGTLQPRGKREEGIVSMSLSSTCSPEESLGCLFKSLLEPQQISPCPSKTKTNSRQKILR